MPELPRLPTGVFRFHWKEASHLERRRVPVVNVEVQTEDGAWKVSDGLTLSAVQWWGEGHSTSLRICSASLHPLIARSPFWARDSPLRGFSCHDGVGRGVTLV